ncbi:Mitogen-activated protein kinase kinase kinase kinase 5 [Balamuthia mandrillaris]
MEGVNESSGGSDTFDNPQTPPEEMSEQAEARGLVHAEHTQQERGQPAAQEEEEEEAKAVVWPHSEEEAHAATDATLTPFFAQASKLHKKGQKLLSQQKGTEAIVIIREALALYQSTETVLLCAHSRDFLLSSSNNQQQKKGEGEREDQNTKNETAEQEEEQENKISWKVFCKWGETVVTLAKALDKAIVQQQSRGDVQRQEAITEVRALLREAEERYGKAKSIILSSLKESGDADGEAVEDFLRRFVKEKESKNVVKQEQQKEEGEDEDERWPEGARALAKVYKVWGSTLAFWAMWQGKRTREEEEVIVAKMLQQQKEDKREVVKEKENSGEEKMEATSCSVKDDPSSSLKDDTSSNEDKQRKKTDEETHQNANEATEQTEPNVEETKLSTEALFMAAESKFKRSMYLDPHARKLYFEWGQALLMKAKWEHEYLFVEQLNSRMEEKVKAAEAECRDSYALYCKAVKMFFQFFQLLQYNPKKQREEKERNNKKENTRKETDDAGKEILKTKKEEQKVALSPRSAVMQERRLGKDVAAALLSWGEAIDAMVNLKQCYNAVDAAYLPQQQLTAELDLFYALYTTYALLFENVSVAPIMGLALSRNAMVQKEALNVLRHLSRHAAHPLRQEASQKVELVEAIQQAEAEHFRMCVAQELNALPPEANAVIKEAGLTVDDIVAHFDLFRNCLWYETGEHVQHPFVPAKPDKHHLLQRLRRKTEQRRRRLHKRSTMTNGTNCSNSNDDRKKSSSGGSDVGEGRNGEGNGKGKEKEASHENGVGEKNAAARQQKPAISDKDSKTKEFESLLIRKDPHQDYIDWSSIGEGGFGEVYTAYRIHDKKRVAIKMIKSERDEDLKTSKREIRLLNACIHPNIVRFVSAYYWKDTTWVVMEYCDGGTLKALYEEVELGEGEIAYICHEILQALAYLHARGQIHRDLKCDNVLLHLTGEVKLADLGLCGEARTKVEHSMAGSKNFMAPEMIKRRGYNQKLDIWGFGCLVYEMANQGAPYNKECGLRVLWNIGTVGAPPLSEPWRWSAVFLDFLERCLQVDPAARSTADQLLKHPFLQKAVKKEDIARMFHLVFLGTALKLSGFL